MDFDFTQEHEMIRQTVRDFAEKEIRPIAAKIDQTGEFPRATIAKMASLGLLGVTIPTEYEGAGLDTISLAIAVEEVARVCGSHALIMAAHNSLCTGNIYLAGSEEQKNRYLPDLASGRRLGAWALTEPKSGSDAAAMETTAKRTADGWIISGTKNLCTNATVAGTFVIMAKTDPAKGNRGTSAFVVERGHPGLHVGKDEDKLGVRASPTAQVILTDCHLPKDALLGNENEGFVNALQVLDTGRIGIGSMAVGLAQGAFEESVKY
ncbi:MAG: acyl-CoA dehydrogenase family protein, partial [Thermoplasmata archaeon]